MKLVETYSVKVLRGESRNFGVGLFRAKIVKRELVEEGSMLPFGVRVIVLLNNFLAVFLLCVGLTVVLSDKNGFVSSFFSLSFFALFSCLFFFLARGTFRLRKRARVENQVAIFLMILFFAAFSSYFFGLEHRGLPSGSVVSMIPKILNSGIFSLLFLTYTIWLFVYLNLSRIKKIFVG